MVKIIISTGDSRKLRAFKTLIALQNNENITKQDRNNKKIVETSIKTCKRCKSQDLIHTYFTTYCNTCGYLHIKR